LRFFLFGKQKARYFNLIKVGIYIYAAVAAVILEINKILFVEINIEWEQKGAHLIQNRKRRRNLL